MFKKIVSQIPYSPSVVRSLGVYAKRLRKEEFSRRIGLFLIIIALAIQLFIVFSPSESANANKLSHQNEESSLSQNSSAVNISQDNVDATSVIAQAGDKIVYTLTAENNNQEDASSVFKINLDDILEYANILDISEGHLQMDTNKPNSGTLYWDTMNLKPGEKASHSFVIQIKSMIPAMARSSEDKTSYDCKIDNTFGNTTSIAVHCPTPKIIEQIISNLPKIGTNYNLLFAVILLTLTVFFYLRTRQLEKEVRVIRHKMSAGSL